MDLSDLKYIGMSEEEKTPYLLQDMGDILFNRTKSKELVGKCWPSIIFPANSCSRRI